MTVIGRQFAIQPKFRVAKLAIMCVGTKFDYKDLPPFLAEMGKAVRILTNPLSDQLNSAFQFNTLFCIPVDIT